MQKLRIVWSSRMACIVVILCLSVGCLREKRSGCSEGLFLKFRYATADDLRMNPEFPETDHLSVFIFDGSGLFVCEKKDSAVQIGSGYTMQLPFYEGQYQFVVWSGLSGSYEITTCVAGETRIEDFTLQLMREDDNRVSTLPPLLYYGRHEAITLTPDRTQEVTIGLRRITNTVRVIIHVPGAETPPLVSIHDNNGSYNYCGELIADEFMEYSPLYTQSPDLPDTWIADFNVMGLHDDSDARLTVSQPDNESLYDEKLVKGLLGANPNIDFNRDHDFTVEITFNDYFIPVSILVNDWEIITEDIN